MKNIIFFLSLLIPTLASAQIPHCNHITASNTGYSTEFVVSGKKWNCYVVTYMFLNGTNDMVGTTEWDAVRQAFAVWQPHTNLLFREVFNQSEADIRISWHTGDHGDGFPFVGSGGVFAHAFDPPPTLGDLAGDIHFDDSETWTNAFRGIDANQPIDLVTWATHEIGHALGLLHSLSLSAVMYNYYPGSRRQLTPDDIDGIQSIYGKPMKINGEMACDDLPRTFQLENLSQNVQTVTWNVSPASMFQTGSGFATSGTGTTANLKSKPSQQGTATLSYILTDACGRSATISKQIQVYPSAVITTPNVGGEFCKTINYEFQNHVAFIGEGFASTSTFEVQKISTNFSYYVSGNKMFIQPYATGYISFKVRVLGYCGWSAWKTFQYNVINCSGGGFFKVYPNPAKESLTIDFTTDTNEDQKQESLGEVKIELYNSYQKLVFETTFKEEQKDRKLKIDTTKLPNGVYYLKLINNKEVYTERIVIEN